MVPTFLQDAFFKGIGQDEDCQENGKLYLGLVDAFQGRSKDDLSSSYPGEVLHEHHILPKSRFFWPEFKNYKENLVVVPVTVHFMVLHKILLQCFPKGSRKRRFMILPYTRNLNQLLKDPSFHLNENEQNFYQKCKDEIRGSGNPMFGTKLMHRWDDEKRKWIEERRLPEEFPLNENWILGKAPNKEKEKEKMETTEINYKFTKQTPTGEIYSFDLRVLGGPEEIQKFILAQLSENNVAPAKKTVVAKSSGNKLKGRARPCSFRTFLLENLQAVNSRLNENIKEDAVQNCIFSLLENENADAVRKRIRDSLKVRPESAARIYSWYVNHRKSDWENPSNRDSLVDTL